jgi:hypothetical protein
MLFSRISVVGQPLAGASFHGVYQLDLITPGSSPSEAMLRKQIRQMPNLRIKARERPQIGQRLYSRTLNFALRVALILSAFLAKPFSSCQEMIDDSCG